MDRMRDLIEQWAEGARVSLSGTDVDELLEMIRTEAYVDDAKIMAMVETTNVQSMRVWCNRHGVPRVRLAFRDDVIEARDRQPMVARAHRRGA